MLQQRAHAKRLHKLHGRKTHVKKITQNLSSKKTSVPASHISSVSALCQTKAVNEPGGRMSRSDSSHLLAVLMFNLQAFLVNTSLFPTYALSCHRVEIRRFKKETLLNECYAMSWSGLLRWCHRTGTSLTFGADFRALRWSGSAVNLCFHMLLLPARETNELRPDS